MSDIIHILKLEDLILIPIYLILIHFLIKIAIIKDDLQVFKKAWKIKVIFTILNLLIFHFYYNGATDGIEYQKITSLLNSNFNSNHWKNVLEYVFKNPDNYSSETINVLSGSEMPLASNRLISINFILSHLILCSNYAITSLFFSLISTYGLFLIYKVFINIYPQYSKELTYTIFYIPSICFWSSCYMKDPLTMAGLGFLFYSLYFILIKGNIKIKNIILLIIGIYFLLIKIYILVSAIPLFAIWILTVYKKRIKNIFIKYTLLLLLSVMSFYGINFSLNKIGELDPRYAIQNITYTAETMSEYLSRADQNERSTYDIGLIDFSNPITILKVFPNAVVVSLFRPFIWEARKPIYIPAILEALASIILIIIILFKIGLLKTMRYIFNNPIILFSILFSIFFSFMTGVTSGNFGTLVRYKICCLPFFYSALIIIYLVNKPAKKIKL